MFDSIDDFISANKEAGFHFFDEGTMSFFNSQIESDLLFGRYFITSKKFDHESPRLYSVRRCLDDDSVQTIGDFQGHKSMDSAKRAVKVDLLTQAVADANSADKADVETMEMVSDTDSYVSCDTEWMVSYNAEDRSFVSAEAHSLESEDEVWLIAHYFELSDLLCLDTDSRDRIAEHTEYSALDLESALDDIGLSDDLPIEYVGIKSGIASYIGVENMKIVGIDTLQPAIGSASMAVESYGGIGSRSEWSYEKKDRGSYAACETIEFAIDTMIYREVDADKVDDLPLFSPEYWESR